MDRFLGDFWLLSKHEGSAPTHMHASISTDGARKKPSTRCQRNIRRCILPYRLVYIGVSHVGNWSTLLVDITWDIATMAIYGKTCSAVITCIFDGDHLYIIWLQRQAIPLLSAPFHKDFSQYRLNSTPPFHEDYSHNHL